MEITPKQPRQSAPSLLKTVGLVGLMAYLSFASVLGTMHNHPAGEYSAACAACNFQQAGAFFDCPQVASAQTITFPARPIQLAKAPVPAGFLPLEAPLQRAPPA